MELDAFTSNYPEQRQIFNQTPLIEDLEKLFDGAYANAMLLIKIAESRSSLEEHCEPC